MGPGSESIISHQHHYQHLPNVGAAKAKANKKPNAKSNPSPSWFYDQMKGTVSAYENGKSHHRQTSKPVNKKSSSPQQFYANSKPVAVKRSFSQNETVINQGNQWKSSIVPEQRNNYGGKQHQSTRNSPVKGMPLFATPPRQSSLTPPMVYSHSQTSSPKPILQAGKPFYAGAKFESHPSHMVLPTPPSHWTAPLQRSQSQPSSPTLKSMQKGVESVAIDLNSLFGSPNHGSVAKSFPGERMMQALIRAEEKKKDAKQALGSKEVSSDEESVNETVSDGENKDVVKKEASPVNLKVTPDTIQLKRSLGLLTLSNMTSPIVKEEPERTLSLTCHAAATPKKSYKEMSAQLKFLMNVAA
jgi:hypothetical protein